MRADAKRSRVLSAASDGTRQLSLPALGVTLKAERGQDAQTWLTIERTGRFYGTAFCEQDPRPAPITIESTSEADWEAWAGRNARPKDERR